MCIKIPFFRASIWLYRDYVGVAYWVKDTIRFSGWARG